MTSFFLILCIAVCFCSSLWAQSNSLSFRDYLQEVKKQDLISNEYYQRAQKFCNGQFESALKEYAKISQSSFGGVVNLATFDITTAVEFYNQNFLFKETFLTLESDEFVRGIEDCSPDDWNSETHESVILKIMMSDYLGRTGGYLLSLTGYSIGLKIYRKLASLENGLKIQRALTASAGGAILAVAGLDLYRLNEELKEGATEDSQKIDLFAEAMRDQNSQLRKNNIQILRASLLMTENHLKNPALDSEKKEKLEAYRKNLLLALNHFGVQN